MVEPVFLVHGGAGDIPLSRVEGKIIGVKRSAQAGYKILKEGGSVVDAVEEAVRIMEDDEVFNAGYGSVLNLNGEVEMDASIMEGTNLRAGCLGAVKDIKHPISLARLVMAKTKHVFLVGEGAKEFAKEQGVPILAPGSLVSKNAINALKKYKESAGVAHTEIGPDSHIGGVGTVGAVAVDKDGHVAVATSTGGINAKMVGRVGDTAVLGSGSYADDNIGAVSTTGHGETIMKYCLAHAILKSIDQGHSPQEATDKNIQAMTKRLQNTAGAITVSIFGEVGIGFSSQRMAWAYQQANEVHFGIDQGQHEVETVD